MIDDEELVIIQESTIELIKVINYLGQDSTRHPISGNLLLKNLIIDILKRVNANLNGFSILLNSFSKKKVKLFTTPMALCMRGALGDCLTAIYLYSISEDKKTLSNEVKVLSIDYAKYLYDYHKLILEIESSDEREIKIKMDNWIIDFKRNNSDIFNSLDNTWNLKTYDKLRSDSKYIKTKKKPTEKFKYEWLKEIPEGKNYTSLYVLFRYFSQHQHYNFANRVFIEDNTLDDFHNFKISLLEISKVLIVFIIGLEEFTNKRKSQLDILNQKLSVLTSKYLDNNN